MTGASQDRRAIGVDRLPAWVALAVGAVSVALGASIVLRPFASLAVLLLVLIAGLIVAGVAEFVASTPAAWLRWSRGALYLLGALVVVVRPGWTIAAVAVLVGVALLVGAVLEFLELRHVAGFSWWTTLLSGIASTAFGVLALTWPDVTVLLVAALFGARLVILGGRLILGGLRRVRHRSDVASTNSTSVRPRWLALGRSALSLLVAGGLVLVSVSLHRGSPRPDGFYDPPATVPTQPGQLLRSEPFTTALPAGATAVKILYTTTRDEGQSAVASALVVVPSGPSVRPRPVIAWAHGTTGAAPGCAPSLAASPFESGAMFVLDQVVQRGWAMVATDYVGLGTMGPHPYLIGQGEGRSVLDAVRAAQQVNELNLAQDTVIWGHSQGGNAALWAGGLAPTYASELKIRGVAAMAPASNLPGLIENLPTVTGGSLFAGYVIESYAAIYPDVRFDDYIRPGARIVVHEAAARCLGEPGILVSVLGSLFLDKPIWTGDPYRGAFKSRLDQNVPTLAIPAPLLIAQGSSDTLVVPSAQETYVQQRCAAGQKIDYRTYAGRDHVPLVQPDSPLIPDLFAWTSDRLTNKTVPSGTC